MTDPTPICGLHRIVDVPGETDPLGRPVSRVERCDAPAGHDGEHDWQSID